MELLLPLPLALAAPLCVAPAPIADPTGDADPVVVVHAENPTLSVSRSSPRRPHRESVELLLPRSGSYEKDVRLEYAYRMSDLELKQYWTRPACQSMSEWSDLTLQYEKSDASEPGGEDSRTLVLQASFTF